MSPLSRLLRALRNNRWRELADVLVAQVTLVRAQAMLWRRPLGEFVNAMSGPRAVLIVASAGDWRTCERLARAVDRAARFGIFHPRCLVRAIALSSLLDGQGVRGHRIKIGVRWSEGAFVAHAWVEFAGCVLGEETRSALAFAPLTDVRVAPGRFRARSHRTSIGR